MNRVFALVFIFLYVYSIAGYIALFSVLKSHVRSEIKSMLKAGVPEKELVKLAFYTSSLGSGTYAIPWIEEYEFRYNDTQEHLFENLDTLVQQEMGGPAHASKFDTLMDVFEDSYSYRYVHFNLIFPAGIHTDPLVDQYASVKLEIPSLPPRAFI